MKLSAIIVNYYHWPETAALVSQLLESAGRRGDFEVIVVDNGAAEGDSHARSCGGADQRLPRDERVRVIEAADNGGFGAGVNLGAAAARGDYLLVMNPDLRLERSSHCEIDFVARVLKLIESDRSPAPPQFDVKNAVVGFAFRGPDGQRQHSAGYFPRLWWTLLGQFYPRSRRKYRILRTRRPQRVDWVTGACFLVSRRLFERLDGMDERFFLYYEEVDLCRRARDAGAEVWYNPRITLVHLDPLENRRPSPALIVATRHSQLLYFEKHLPRAEGLWLAGTIALEARLRRSRREPELERRAWQLVGAVVRDLLCGRMQAGKDYVNKLRVDDRRTPTEGSSTSPKAA